MTRAGFTESVVEDATLGWLVSLGYAVLHGSDIAAGKPAAETACACPYADRRSDPMPCGETLTDIHNCLQNVMRLYLEAVA